MKIIFNIRNTLNNAKKSFKRFPIAMIFSILSAILLILGVKYESSKNFNGNFTRYGFLCFVAMLAFIFLGLFLEGLKNLARNEEELQKYKLIKIAAYILSIPLLYGIKENILNIEEKLFSFNNGYKFVGLVLFFIVASFYVSKIFYHKDYIAYVIKMMGALFISMLYSVFLFLGIAAIFFALVHLFGLNLSFNIYMYAAIIVYIPFNAGIFLSNVPKSEEFLSNYELSKVTKVLLLYILMPLFSIYLIILYTYFAKILFIGELPKNIITHLILWFSLFSVVFIFALGMVKDSNAANEFRKIFPILMIPLICFMFYSISIRVNEYGITENRYFVVAAGIWALASMIYYVFYRSNSNITVPIILSVIILISTIGPVSAYNISATSQNYRLKQILTKNNMLNGNQIIAKSDVSDSDKRRISEIVDYLNNKHRRYEQKYLPADFDFSDNAWKKTFGFNKKLFDEDRNIYYSYNSQIPVDIKGYSKLFVIDSFDETSDMVGNYKIKRKLDNINISYISKNNEHSIVSINMTDLRNKLSVLKKSKEIIDAEDIAIKGNSGNIEYKIVFTNLNFYIDAEGNDYDYNCSFYLLTNEKK